MSSEKRQKDFPKIINFDFPRTLRTTVRCVDRGSPRNYRDICHNRERASSLAYTHLQQSNYAYQYNSRPNTNRKHMSLIQIRISTYVLAEELTATQIIIIKRHSSVRENDNRLLIIISCDYSGSSINIFIGHQYFCDTARHPG